MCTGGYTVLTRWRCRCGGGRPAFPGTSSIPLRSAHTFISTFLFACNLCNLCKRTVLPNVYRRIYSSDALEMQVRGRTPSVPWHLIHPLVVCSDLHFYLSICRKPSQDLYGGHRLLGQLTVPSMVCFDVRHPVVILHHAALPRPPSRSTRSSTMCRLCRTAASARRAPGWTTYSAPPWSWSIMHWVGR